MNAARTFFLTWTLCVSGCGGGGGGGSTPVGPNAHETALIGVYQLVDFEMESAAGGTLTASEVDSFSGTLVLDADLRYDVFVMIDGEATTSAGEWRAPDEVVFVADADGNPPPNVGDYEVRGDVLILHSWEGLVEVTRYWERL